MRGERSYTNAERKRGKDREKTENEREKVREREGWGEGGGGWVHHVGILELWDYEGLIFGLHTHVFV